MDFLATLFTVLLGDPALPTDPHPHRTMYRGLVVRVLDDAEFRQSLGLNSEQSLQLVRLMKDLDRKQEELLANVGDDPVERASRLQRGAIRRQQALLDELQRAVGEAAVRRLAGAASKQWGPGSAFAVGLKHRLEVTDRQQRDADRLLQEFSKKWIRPASTEQTNATSFELTADYNALRRNLTGILTEEQRRLQTELEDAAGRPSLQLTVQAEVRNEDRQNRPTRLAIHRPPTRLLKLIGIDEILDLMKVDAELRSRLNAYRKKALAREIELATLQRKDPDTQKERADSLAAFDAEVADEIRELLGADPFRRLTEIQRLAAGVGSAFSREMRQRLEITDAQYRACLADLGKVTSRFAVKIEEKPDAAARLGRSHEEELEAAMLSALTEPQRRRWREMMGEPIRAEVLKRIQKKLQIER